MVMNIEVLATKDDLIKINQLYLEHEEMYHINQAVELYLLEHEILKPYISKYSCVLDYYSYHNILNDKIMANFQIREEWRNTNE